MKWHKPNKIEWVSFLALMLLLASGGNYLLFDRQMLSIEVFAKSSLVMYGVGLLAWYAHISLTHYINNRFSHYTQISQRILWLLLLHIAIIFLTYSIYFLGYDYFNFLGYRLNVERFVWGLIITFYVTSVATTIWGFRHTVKQLKEGLIEKEELVQENLVTEFESLKKQISPHFLYNCLNSLSALIEENTTEAETFVDELSKVYRYLLQNSEDGLTELSKELEFIDSYYYLLKTRYGTGIRLRMKVPEQSRQFLIPTHTLQLLVENAVKHNSLDKKVPLDVLIQFKNPQKLVVSNTLQKKMIQVYSAGMGLGNLQNKYRLLNRGAVTITEENNRFVVELPLIKKVAQEDTKQNTV